MSAFGRKNGMGAGNRPTFGVARPMKGGGIAPKPAEPEGGDQFPPIDSVPLPAGDPAEGQTEATSEAMSRLNERVAASGDRAEGKAEGFEAAVHRIKEQVLPRLLERV
ncbi:MAG TPA: CpaF family protein, partial [Allosphingosinicella sp.]|nr:CpaF family protein [Allosphingosinicella sp.]